MPVRVKKTRQKKEASGPVLIQSEPDNALGLAARAWPASENRIVIAKLSYWQASR
jgi:hypothetical protein